MYVASIHMRTYVILIYDIKVFGHMYNHLQCLALHINFYSQAVYPHTYVCIHISVTIKIFQLTLSVALIIAPNLIKVSTIETSHHSAAKCNAAFPS